jgi:hypothetical protein
MFSWVYVSTHASPPARAAAVYADGGAWGGGGLRRDLSYNAINGTVPASLSALTNLDTLCAPARPPPALFACRLRAGGAGV